MKVADIILLLHILNRPWKERLIFSKKIYNLKKYYFFSLQENKNYLIVGGGEMFDGKDGGFFNSS